MICSGKTLSSTSTRNFNIIDDKTYGNYVECPNDFYSSVGLRTVAVQARFADAIDELWHIRFLFFVLLYCFGAVDFAFVVLLVVEYLTTV